MEKRAFKIKDNKYWYIYTADDIQQAARFHMETYGSYDTDVDDTTIVELEQGTVVKDEFGADAKIEHLVARELFTPSLISTNRD